MVARGWSSRALVQLAYAISVAESVSFLVEADGVLPTRIAEIVDALRREFDLTPAGMSWTCHGKVFGKRRSWLI